MAYKSLLTVLTDPTLADAPLNQLIALAEAQDAHVEALCLGVDRTQTGYYYAGANAMILQETLSRAHEEAAAVLAHARGVLGKSGVRWSAEDGVAQIADLARHVALRARFADLVVLPQPYGDKRGAEVEPVVEAALFDGQAPVLVVPDKNEAKGQFRTIVVAWNESAEAMAAIRKALPFLVAADLVHIAIIDPPSHGPERSDPGGLLSQMLARGLNAPITTSAGRLFDGVAALIGLHQQVTFEGQAAMALEFAADARENSAYNIHLAASASQPSTLTLDWQPMVEEILSDLRRGVSSGMMAARFHNALVRAIVATAQEIGEERVALTGGCFQNRLLVERTSRRLRTAGFEVLLHRQVPPNDGGISLGQIAVAAAQFSEQ